MEDENKEDKLEETDTGETSPESQETESEETEKESKDEEKNIDFKKELEKVQPQPKSELEKAQKALHFNAERLKELGGDPAEVLKLKREESVPDVKGVVQREFIERDVRAMAKNEDHFKLMMHYVDDKKLSAEDAYVLSMKGQILRSITELKRAGVQYAKPDNGGRKVDIVEVPERPQQEVQILERRGMRFNPKTKTYQGRFYEEYYDSAEKVWKSRKLNK